MSGITGGPNVVRDGIVLSLDTTDNTSFRGEPTTNIFPRSSTTLAFTNAYDGSNYGFGASTNIQQEFDDSLRPESQSRVTKVSRINSGVNQRTYVHVGLHSPLSSVRVVSFWYYGTFGTQIRPYNNDSSASLAYLDSNGNWIGSGERSVTIPVLTNQWQWISVRITNNGVSAGTGWSWFVMHRDNQPTVLPNTDYWAFSEFIYENKENPSYFYTTGTRGATVATGGGWADLSGNSNHGELINNVTYNSDNLGSLVFSANNERVTTPITSFGNNTTWSVWVNRTSSNNSINMFMGRTLPYFGLGSDNRVMFSNTIGGSQRTIYSSAISSPDGKWFFLTFTTSYNGTTTLMLIYINGSFATSNSYAGSQGGSTGSFSIGDGRSTSSWFRFNGHVANIQIYNRTLSPQEVLQNYNATKGRYGL